MSERRRVFGGAGVNPNGHEYVDFGLPTGTLWAKYSVGGYSGYGGNTYKFGTNDNNATYYEGACPLPLSNDTANVVMGGTWVMPDHERWKELETYCEIKSVSNDIAAISRKDGTSNLYIYMKVGEYWKNYGSAGNYANFAAITTTNITASVYNATRDTLKYVHGILKGKSSYKFYLNTTSWTNQNATGGYVTTTAMWKGFAITGKTINDFSISGEGVTITDYTSSSGVLKLSFTANPYGYARTLTATITYKGYSETISISLKYLDPNTVSLFHFDTTFSGTYKDDYENSWYAEGTPSASTSKYKFGARSLALANNSLMRLDTGLSVLDFTIEAWVYPTTTSTTYNYRRFFSVVGSPISFGYGLPDTSASYIYVGPLANGGYLSISRDYVTRNAWHHIAMVYDNSTKICKIYVDGVYNSRIQSVLFSSPTITLQIKDGYSCPGYMDEFRFSKGLRYTSDFTPQTSAFT